NKLLGVVPSYSHLSNLTGLAARGNRLTHVSALFAPRLRSLDVSENNITGELNFLTSLPNLQSITISHNHFHRMPLMLPARLKEFIAIDCSLQGPVPSSWSNFTSLETLLL